jgi:hypothetical protein
MLRSVHPYGVLQGVLATAGAAFLLLMPAHLVPASAVPQQDAWEHAILFMVLAVGWLRSGLPLKWIAALGSAMAIVSELLQGVLPGGRVCDSRDAAVDLAAVVTMVAIVAGWRRLWSGLDLRSSAQ